MDKIRIEKGLRKQIQSAVDDGKFADIPIEELIKDRDEALKDMRICELALGMEITSYGGKYSVQTRLDGNKQQIVTIDAELKRRSK